jgi:hypothetical protein
MRLGFDERANGLSIFRPEGDARDVDVPVAHCV